MQFLKAFNLRGEELAQGHVGIVGGGNSAVDAARVAIRQKAAESVTLLYRRTGALGLYTYYERLAQGLRQLMAGSRKFAMEHIARDDIAALTREAAQVSGIQYVMEVDQGKVERIFSSYPPLRQREL